MACCSAPQVKDLTNGLGKHRNWYCMKCKAHEWKGTRYTKKEWDAFVNRA